MAALRVLIVDDQHDVRRVLATGIRTLGADIEVMEVPSGEEAHLEAIRRPVQLLVTDVRLPGISGLELLSRIRRRNPDVKVIMITGLEEPGIRRQVSEADIDAYFYKPIHMADFLNAVEHSLGLKDAAFDSSTTQEEDDSAVAAPPPSIKWISNLRQALNAQAVIMIDILGQVEARAGELPDPSAEAEWLTAITSVLGTSAKVSNLLKAHKPSGFWYLSGLDYHLCVTHLGKSHAALIVTRQPLASAQFEAILEYSKLLNLDVQALTIESEALENIPFEEVLPEISEAEEAALEELPPEELPALEALFSKAQNVQGQDINSFWDALTDHESGAEGAFGPKTLTYEQAMKLGLAPGEDAKEGN